MSEGPLDKFLERAKREEVWHRKQALNAGAGPRFDMHAIQESVWNAISGLTQALIEEKKHP